MAVEEQKEQKKQRRELDLKLVYDCLANASGAIPLHSVLSQWPKHPLILYYSESFWRQHASANGVLDWQTFVQGFHADPARHQRSKPRNVSSVHSVAQVTSGEIERFLCSCRPVALVKALETAGRDVHRWQVSIHSQERNKTESDRSSQYHHEIHSRLPVTREKEELLRGTEVLRNTQQWFQNRLAALSAEEHFAKLCPENMLAEVDGDDDDHEGNVLLYHLKHINNHLSSLALSANVSLRQPTRSISKEAHRPTPEVNSQKRSTIQKGGLETSWLQHSVSIPAKSTKHIASKPIQRSSSFTDKSNACLKISPMRHTSSMTTLVRHKVTDYPGHKTTIPYIKRPIRHSTSVQYLQPMQSPQPPQRAYSSRSLPQESKLVSEVL